MARERYDVRARSCCITGRRAGIGAEAARQLVRRGARNVSLVGHRARAARAARARARAARGLVRGRRDRQGRARARGRRNGRALRRHRRRDRERRHRADRHRRGRSTRTTFERTIEINLLGVWRTVRAALPHVVARRGYILPIASLAAALHMPLMAHYAATKAGRRGILGLAPRGEIRAHRHEGRRRLLQLHRHRHGARVARRVAREAAARRTRPGPSASVASVAGRRARDRARRSSAAPARPTPRAGCRSRWRCAACCSRCSRTQQPRSAIEEAVTAMRRGAQADRLPRQSAPAGRLADCARL